MILSTGRHVADVEGVGQEGVIEPAAIEIGDVHPRFELVGANLLDHAENSSSPPL